MGLRAVHRKGLPWCSAQGCSLWGKSTPACPLHPPLYKNSLLQRKQIAEDLVKPVLLLVTFYLAPDDHQEGGDAHPWSYVAPLRCLMAWTNEEDVWLHGAAPWIGINIWLSRLERGWGSLFPGMLFICTITTWQSPPSFCLDVANWGQLC